MEGMWRRRRVVRMWKRVVRRVEGRGHKRRGEEMLPKIFSGFSEGGCWLIIGRFGFWIW